MAIGDGVGREVLVQQVLLLISHIFGWVKYKRVLSTLLSTDAFERDGIGTEMPDSLSVDDVSLIFFQRAEPLSNRLRFTPLQMHELRVVRSFPSPHVLVSPSRHDSP